MAPHSEAICFLLCYDYTISLKNDRSTPQIGHV